MTARTLAETVNDWYRENARELPWRRDGYGAWGILVSEFMLQQTPVSRVIPRLEDWLKRWPTPADLAAAPPGDAVRAWANLGYPRRALWLHRAAVQITKRYGGEVPQQLPELLALSGIGPYTARAIAAFAYGERHPVVDTNTRRVIARAVKGQAEAAPPSAARDIADMGELLPTEQDAARMFNAAAMELGAVICTARAPRCAECPIAELCVWRAAGYPDYSGPRKAVQKRYEGSDRHVRGLILAELRATQHPVASSAIVAVWSDADQRERALAGLVADGLAVPTPEGLTLP